MGLTMRTGDLFDADLPAFAHGCNSLGAMGSRIAFEFRRRWPDMYREYRHQCVTGRFDPGDTFVWEDRVGRLIYNLATQPRPGPCASLDAIARAANKMVRHAALAGVPAVGLPPIGAGIGGLAWPDVHREFEMAVGASEVELVVYTLEPLKTPPPVEVTPQP